MDWIHLIFIFLGPDPDLIDMNLHHFVKIVVKNHGLPFLNIWILLLK